MTRPLRLKEMSPGRVATLLAENPRLLVPAGTLERRGNHLPLGCDTVILERLVDELSARTGIARAPALEYGVHATAEDLSVGTAALTRKTLHRMVNELIAVWEERAGVRDILILTAHAADQHLEALSTIRTIGRVRVADILSLSVLSPMREASRGPWHGGEVDTSLMLHIAPELVDHAMVPHNLPASAEKGARFFEAILATLIKELGSVTAAVTTTSGVADA
jgi:creatinine amidohydrolase